MLVCTSPDAAAHISHGQRGATERMANITLICYNPPHPPPPISICSASVSSSEAQPQCDVLSAQEPQGALQRALRGPQGAHVGGPEQGLVREAQRECVLLCAVCLARLGRSGFLVSVDVLPQQHVVSSIKYHCFLCRFLYALLPASIQKTSADKVRFRMSLHKLGLNDAINGDDVELVRSSQRHNASQRHHS